MVRIFFLFIGMGSYVLIWGQDQYLLKGHVMDEYNENINYGDAILYQEEKIIQYALIDSGQFVFDPLPAGAYRLTISCLGYEPILNNISLTEDLSLDFELRINPEDLEEIIVAATRNPIQVEAGQVQVQVEGTFFEQQSSTLDLLALLPQIQLGSDRESLNIIGRGVPLIYLDHQRISMDQLMSLTVQEIATIEIIHNPSAKYEAEGESVIVIHRKMNSRNGWNGSIQETASWRRKFNNYWSTNLHHKQGDLEWKANLGYNHLGFWESNVSKYQFAPLQIATDNENLATGLRPQLIFGGGVHYTLSPNAYVSTQLHGRLQEDNFPILTSTDFTERQETQSITTRSENAARRKFFNSNINYHQQIEQWNGTLFLGLGYAYHLRDLLNDIYVNTYHSGEQYIQDRNQLYQIGVYSFRGDLEKPVSNLLTVSSGINLYVADAYAFSEFEFLDIDDQIRSEYDYLETNWAGYLEGSGQINRINYSAGIRLEKTTVQGGFRQVDTLVLKRNQLNIFPNVRMSLDLKENTTASLWYGTSIRRPNYLNASSISTYLNPYLEFERNPNLQAAILQELSLNLQIHQQVWEVAASRIMNPTFFGVVYDESNERFLVSPLNYDQSQAFRIGYTLPINYKFWNMTYTLQMHWNKFEDDLGDIGLVRPYLYYYTNHRWKLAEGMFAGANLWGMTRRQQGILDQNALFVLNLNLSKTWKEKWTVSLQANDLFRGMIYKNGYTFTNVQALEEYFIDQKAWVIALRYNFGRSIESKYQNEAVDEQLDRM